METCIAQARRRLKAFCLAGLLVGCGSGTVQLDPSLSNLALSPGPAPGDPCADAITAATGKWVTVVNNGFTPPDSTGINFFSFNQPSVNSRGRIVFRGRAKAPTGGGAGEPLSGVWLRDICDPNPTLVKVADRKTKVPAPNSANVDFNEFPSIPRIDQSSELLATRGTHQPVETVALPDGSTTKAGTTGVYFFDSLLQTGINNLGNLLKFHEFGVPGEPDGTKFDQFPGSPSCADNRFVVFKGNYSVGGTGKTGVYYRNIRDATSHTQLIASSNNFIPGPNSENTTFGSTAPPSAANGRVVFTGLDIEEAPTKGGIFLADIAPSPPLTALVRIGGPVPDSQGQALADGSSFNAIGEGLSYDGRYLSFWGAWGNDKREIILECPKDGNKDLIAYCLANSPLPDGKTPVQVSVNQGIFVHDTQTGVNKMAARCGQGETFQDFLFWVYSGRPPGVGDGGDGDGGEAEPPRWRSSAFSATDGTRGVAFKASKTPGVNVPSSGLYGAALVGGNLSPVQKILEVGDSASLIDQAAPTNSTISAVALEREAIRSGWFAVSVSFLSPALESWAGIYVTYLPTFTSLPPSRPTVI